MSMCRDFSYVVEKEYMLWPMHSLSKTLLAFALLHFVLQGQTCLLFWVSLDLLLLHSNPFWWKGHLFLMLVLEGVLGLHRTGQLQLLWLQWLGIDLDYCDVEWLALETHQDHSVILGTAPKYCTLDSFVDDEVYSIFPKGFLSTIVDIMVIWIKFACSRPF